MTNTIHLVDASPFIFRAFFSLPEDMASPGGELTNAVYGFASFLLKLIADENVTHLGLTYDRSLNSSFRNDFFPEYKANRALPPPDLEAQIDRCVEIGEALGAAVFIDERYEADDLIAALVDELEPDGHRIVIVTSDKDLAQLVTERVSLFDFARDERYDDAAVVAKFGVRPDQIRDYLGLAGDSVDNIPGVRGVGKKTAAALLEAYDDLEAIYADLDGVATLPIRGARRVQQKLSEAREEAFLSRRLATVAIEAPARASIDDLEWQGVPRSRFHALCDELGFDDLRDRVPLYRDDPAK